MAERPAVEQMRTRGPSHFRQRDITAAIRAVKSAGENVSLVRIAKDGSIELITSRERPTTDAGEINEWDAAGEAL